MKLLSARGDRNQPSPPKIRNSLWCSCGGSRGVAVGCGGGVARRHSIVSVTNRLKDDSECLFVKNLRLSKFSCCSYPRFSSRFPCFIRFPSVLFFGFPLFLLPWSSCCWRGRWAGGGRGSEPLNHCRELVITGAASAVNKSPAKLSFSGPRYQLTGGQVPAPPPSPIPQPILSSRPAGLTALENAGPEKHQSQAFSLSARPPPETQAQVIRYTVPRASAGYKARYRRRVPCARAPAHRYPGTTGPAVQRGRNAELLLRPGDHSPRPFFF